MRETRVLGGSEPARGIWEFPKIRGYLLLGVLRIRILPI